MADPRNPWQAFWRGLRPAILAPLRFGWDQGFWRSALACRAVDRDGNPVPWLTYPALAWLESVDFTGQHVLEFGAGYSTLWWARRAAAVVAIEEDPGWHAALQARLASPTGDSGNVRLLRASPSVCPDLGPALFDVVVIDGGDRLSAARIALARVRDTGIVVLDNAEVSWSPDGRGFPILEMFAQRGWSRVDFCGFAPGTARQHCTAVFFRPASAAFQGASPPRIAPSAIRG